MVRTRFMLSALAAIAVLAANAAHAADYSPPPPQPPPYIPPPPPADCCSSWYLRGFVGVAMNGNYNLEYIPNAANVGNGFTLQNQSETIADSTIIGGGIGYEWNNWLRFEGTAEYRTRARVYAFGNYPPNGLDIYEGYLKSWVFLANAFVDLGTWDCWTPFVGAGVGASYLQLQNFSDVNPNGGFGFGRNPTSWNLAWALYAGVAYNVSKNLKIDLTYRYLNYGSITDTVDCNGGCFPDQFKFKNLYSNDIMLGLRWMCCDTAPPPPRYAPPPYTPPLQSRG